MKIRTIDASEIAQMDRLYRANLINSAGGFKSVNLIGTKDVKGTANLAIFNSVLHIGSHPPLLGFMLRPLSVPRHSFENIRESGYYTINHVHEEMVYQSHQTSAKYAKEINEFEVTGLREEIFDDFPAPFVAEARIKIGLRYLDDIKIKLNETRLVIGQVEKLILDEQYLNIDGSIDLTKAGSLALNGLDHYHLTESLVKLPYAHP
jgi:flavin reductase (DIM6/NTAB) family NADH-FMN oxidoreductase RutF